MGFFRHVTIALLALMFISAGIAHFVFPSAFASIVPPFLPAPVALVYISGVCEILGGIGLFIPRVRALAGWGLVLLLLAVFPANLYMAFYDVPVMGRQVPWWVHLIRLPFQFVLIGALAWACGLGQPGHHAPAPSESQEP